MLTLWLAVGLVARQEAEKRARGGSGKGWMLRGEFEYRDEDKPPEAITVEDIRQAAAKLRPTPAPTPAPATVAAKAAPATPAAPAAPVAVLFERKPEKAPEPAPAAPAPIALTPEAEDVLGMKPVKRTYDLELLLLLAA
jgi:hypothetical protein